MERGEQISERARELLQPRDLRLDREVGDDGMRIEALRAQFPRTLLDPRSCGDENERMTGSPDAGSPVTSTEKFFAKLTASARFEPGLKTRQATSSSLNVSTTSGFA